MEAEKLNPWFQSDFVTLKKGDALDLPVESNSIDVAAQNCLFNIFKADDLKKALEEKYGKMESVSRWDSPDEYRLHKMSTDEESKKYGDMINLYFYEMVEVEVDQQDLRESKIQQIL